MTHQFFILSVFLTAMASSCLAQSDSAGKAQQILAIEQSLNDAIAPADSLLWDKYLDPKCYTITEDGTGFIKKDFLATFHPLPKGFSGYIKVAHPVFTFSGKAAVIHYVADEYETVYGQKLHTTYGVVNTWYQTDSSWKMIGSQVFEIPQLPPAIRLPGQTLKKYTGYYLMLGTGDRASSQGMGQTELIDSNTCTIILKNDSLFMQKKKGGPIVLSAETENIFFRQDDTRGRKIFVKNGTGEMLMLERRNGNDLVWKRIK